MAIFTFCAFFSVFLWFGIEKLWKPQKRLKNGKTRFLLAVFWEPESFQV